MHPLIANLKGKLIVSVQAYPGEPMRDPRTMDQVAQACVAGGAVGIRAQGLADLALINQHVDVPVIGLWKDGHDGVFITPTLTHAIAVAATGSQIVALDGTRRPRPDGLSETQTEDLVLLARQVMAQLALRRAVLARDFLQMEELRAFTVREAPASAFTSSNGAAMMTGRAMAARESPLKL